MSSSRNVVIIGAGGGAMVARELVKTLPKDYSIILIDLLKVAFHQVSSLRSSILPGHETKSIHDLSDFFSKGSKHKYINAKAVEIKEGSVVLDREVEGYAKTIEFEYLVVATGSTYAHPASPTSHTGEGIIEGFKKTQSQVKDADHVMIVGAGPVGVELCGEIKEVYPNKKVTLLASSNYLVNPEMRSLSAKLYSELTSKGVAVHLSSRIDISDLSPGPLLDTKDFNLPNNETVKNVDFIFLATGSKPNVSLIKNSDPNALVKDGGVEVAKVDQQLRLVSEKLKNVFILGDAMGGKTAMNLQKQAPVMTQNIVALTKGNTGQLKAWSPMENTLVVPIGSKGGAGHIPPSRWIGALGGWFVSRVKGADLFMTPWHKVYVASN